MFTKKELQYFFKSNLKIKIICEECGLTVNNPTTACLAHILPKNIFKSVALNQNNLLYLCVSCHAKYDQSWLKAQTMKCWKIALERYKLFKHQVKEIHKILNYFNESNTPALKG